MKSNFQLALRRTFFFISSLVFVLTVLGLWWVISAPSQVHQLSESINLRAPNETLRARIGNDLVEITPMPAGIQVEKDVRIQMPDGTEISANIYRSDSAEKMPVVMAFTSYDKDMRPEDYTINGRGPVNRAMGTHFGDFIVSEETTFEGPDPAFWVPRGYAVVVVDARGTGKSTGNKDPFGQATIDDFSRMVTWASQQPWSSGKVGTLGTSYLAAVQWLVAAQNPEGLSAIIPWEGFTDIYRDVLIHGGIPETSFVRSWLAKAGSMMGTDDEPEFLTRKPLVSHLPLPAKQKSLLMYFLGDSPTYSAIQHKFSTPDLEKIEVPALIAATWSMQGLHSRGAFNGYTDISSSDKWLYTHGQHEWTVMTSQEAMEYQAAFFDHYLKGDPDAMDGKPKVHLEVRKDADTYFVRGEDEWPIARTQYTPLFLDPLSRTLNLEKPTDVLMAQYNSTKDDALEFSYIFDEDTEITGHASLRLWVSMDAGIDMDIFIALSKLDSDGNQILFDNKHVMQPIASRGWIRASHRKLDPAKSTPWRPYLEHEELLPVTPGERFPLDIEILPSSTFFEAGSQLVLTIKGREIFGIRTLQHKLLMNQGRHTVWSGDSYDSFLLLPIIPDQ